MNISCKRCNTAEVYELPDFSLDAKQVLVALCMKSPLLAIQEMQKTHSISHKKGKFITMHLNLKTNSCHRCETPLDSKEYISCPKCKALNFNWNLDS